MRRLLAIFLVLMLLRANICAIAEAVVTLTLPSALKIIEEEAFYGNTSIEKVTMINRLSFVLKMDFLQSG